MFFFFFSPLKLEGGEKFRAFLALFVSDEWFCLDLDLSLFLNMFLLLLLVLSLFFSGLDLKLSFDWGEVEMEVEFGFDGFGSGCGGGLRWWWCGSNDWVRVGVKVWVKVAQSGLGWLDRWGGLGFLNLGF